MQDFEHPLDSATATISAPKRAPFLYTRKHSRGEYQLHGGWVQKDLFGDQEGINPSLSQFSYLLRNFPCQFGTNLASLWVMEIFINLLQSGTNFIVVVIILFLFLRSRDNRGRRPGLYLSRWSSSLVRGVLRMMHDEAPAGGRSKPRLKLKHR